MNTCMLEPVRRREATSNRSVSGWRTTLAACLALAAFDPVRGAGATGPGDDAAADRAIATAIATIAGGAEAPEIDGARIDGLLARELYRPRDFAPLWVGRPDAAARTAVVLAALRGARDEGLDPGQYHVAKIEQRLGASGVRERAELDLLLSDAVMRYGVHVREGAYRPARQTKEVAVESGRLAPLRLAEEAATAADAEALLAGLPPGHAPYRRLREALAHYRRIEAAGGWPVVADGPKLAPGASDPAVRVLRERFKRTGELGPGARGSDVYDAALVKAVKTFQSRHGLAADGTIGPRTRAALGVEVGERIRQIEMAMERWRWLPDGLGERHLMINVAQQRLELREAGATALEMPVVVGKPSWPTPTFSAAVSEIVFNPPWNVPPKIARDELLPKAALDDDFLAREGITVRRRVRIASAKVDSVADGVPAGEASPVVRNGPPRLRQAPGPRNPLGRVKFNMPNGFDVYLHDTPNKGALQGRDRALSHGCIRLGDARGLAEALTADLPGWDDERRKAVLSKWATRTLHLPSPVPVHVVYLTAWQDELGEVHFRDDVYGRDAALAATWGRPRAVRPLPPPPALPPAPAPTVPSVED